MDRMVNSNEESPWIQNKRVLLGHCHMPSLEVTEGSYSLLIKAEGRWQPVVALGFPLVQQVFEEGFHLRFRWDTPLSQDGVHHRLIYTMYIYTNHQNNLGICISNWVYGVCLLRQLQYTKELFSLIGLTVGI